MDKNTTLSTSKMSSDELRNYTARLHKILEGPGAASIRICECCIKIEAPEPGTTEHH